MGDVGFNEADSDNGGINNARGDVASIDLRSIGTGNTLVLLNGRRLVPHPGTQIENYVPVQTVNTNAIPTFGLRRVEVLADGAAALYGTDAVAGVVNNVLRDNFEGFTAQGAIGRDEGGMEEYSFDFQAGKDFNDGKTNVSIMGGYLTRDPLYIWERGLCDGGGPCGALRRSSIRPGLRNLQHDHRLVRGRSVESHHLQARGRDDAGQRPDADLHGRNLPCSTQHQSGMSGERLRRGHLFRQLDFGDDDRGRQPSLRPRHDADHQLGCGSRQSVQLRQSPVRQRRRGLRRVGLLLGRDLVAAATGHAA